MNKAYRKDIVRSVKNGWKRFLSILIITALGVAMLTGLYAACLDMYYSADKFYDKQRLFDIRILSTLGLTEADVDALSRIDGIEAAEGGFNEIVHTEVDGARKSADIIVISQKGLNSPYLLDGRLPEKETEIAVTKKYLEESGKSIGDTLSMEEDNQEESTDESKSSSKEDSKDNSKEEDEPSFLHTAFQITGVVMNPMEIQSNGLASVFRSSESNDYTFFVTDTAVSSDIFTAVYLTLSGTQGMNSYSKEYEARVQTVINHIESNIKKQREQARYDSILTEARTKLEDAKSTMEEEFADADQEFSDAWDEINDGKQKLSEGENTLNNEEQDAKKKISEARLELKKAKQQLANSEKQLTEGEEQLAQGEADLQKNAQKLAEGRKQLAEEKQEAGEQLDAADQQLEEAQTQLEEARTQLEPGIAQLKNTLGSAWPEKEWSALVNAAAALAATGAEDKAIAEATAGEAGQLTAAIIQQNTQIPQIDSLAQSCVEAAYGLGKVNGGQQALDAQKSTFEEQKKAALQKLADAEAELDKGEAQLEAGRQEIKSKKGELKAGKEELADGKTELAEGEDKLDKEEADAGVKITDARKEITDKKKELEDGEAELIQKEQDYAEEKEDAIRELEDGYTELNDIDMAQWYVQDRTSLESYSSLKSDLSSIEAVGRVFPVIFLLVAVLMSLTTMTRMVEEERGLIGTYKGLGFGNSSVYHKYLLFALLACLLGGVLGDLFGFIFMPKFVAVVLEELYSLPQYYLRFDIPYGVGGVMLFTAAIVGATALACRSELTHMPAILMRPKAPRAGSRVLLERITILWKHLKFLNKVTARNLFRYKKRLFMTIGGIVGCTALILCGFAIRDSITDLEPKQYDNIYRYDLMAVFQEKDTEDIVRQLSADSNIKDYLKLRIDSMKIMNTGSKAEKVQLMVIPDGEAIDGYIHIKNTEGALLPLTDSGIYITQNAAQILGVKSGDTVLLQDMELVQCETVVADVVQNYLGNNVYMTQRLYEALFGTYSNNGVLAHLSDTCEDQAAYAEALLDNASVVSAVSTAAVRESYGFDLINAVILLIIIMAGGLAFVVLFTLSNTNISERARELATIKVLGFYDKEVHLYVNKETLILTAVGILAGLPVGRFLSELLTIALKMPSIYFAVYIDPVSYLTSAVITFCFAVTVNWITNRMLDRIDMVEALKSVE